MLNVKDFKGCFTLPSLFDENKDIEVHFTLDFKLKDKTSEKAKVKKNANKRNINRSGNLQSNRSK